MRIVDLSKMVQNACSIGVQTRIWPRVCLQVKRLLNAAYERAQAVLRQNEHELHAVAKQLLEQESLTGTQIKELLANLKKQAPSAGTASAAAA